MIYPHSGEWGFLFAKNLQKRRKLNLAADAKYCESDIITAFYR
jgi:hypothetical protein